MTRTSFYEGFRLKDIDSSYGLTNLGFENAMLFFTRGVLLDVAAYRGVARLASDYGSWRRAGALVYPAPNGKEASGARA